MSRRILVLFFSIMLVGAIWAVRPMSTPLISAAQAQTAADYPASFTGSLVEPSLDRVAIRRTVYVAAYSALRLGGGKGKVDLATTLSIHNTSEERPLNLLRVDYFDTAGNLVHVTCQSPSLSAPLVQWRPSFPLRIRAEEPGRTSSSSGRLTGELPIRLSRPLWLAPSVRRASHSLVAARR